jgi:hypothetical protein
LQLGNEVLHTGGAENTKRRVDQQETLSAFSLLRQIIIIIIINRIRVCSDDIKGTQKKKKRKKTGAIFLHSRFFFFLSLLANMEQLLSLFLRLLFIGK